MQTPPRATPPLDDSSGRTHVFPIVGGTQFVCVNPPAGYGPSAEVATVWPSADSWGPDVELLILALRVTPLDALAGPLDGRSVFDASGTSGMLAVIASRHGAARGWVFDPGSPDPGGAPWLRAHYPDCAPTAALHPARECDAAFFNFYRYPDPARLAQLASALPEGARLVVVGGLLAHAELIEDTCRRAGFEPVDSETPWVDEMQIITLAKARPAGAPLPPCPALPPPTGASDRLARWSSLARSIHVDPCWRIDGTPRPADGPEIAITIAPSLLYGSGGNDVTRMVLETIGRLEPLDSDPAPRVLDLGCGTGILGIACGLRGAARITAMDVCPRARAATIANAEANGVEVQVVDRIDPSQAYDLILANLYGAVWPEYLPLLSSMLRPGGRVVSAGIPASEHDAFEAKLQRAGVRVLRVHRRLGGRDLGWPCAVSRKEADGPSPQVGG